MGIGNNEVERERERLAMNYGINANTNNAERYRLALDYTNSKEEYEGVTRSEWWMRAEREEGQRLKES